MYIVLGSSILDVAIGLVFFYLLLSLICSGANELLEGWLKYRAKDLEKGLRELLYDPNGSGLVKALYEHPLINGLFVGQYDPKNRSNLPSYIPARIFALALLDIVWPSGASSTLNAAAVPDQVRKALKSLLDAAGQDATKTRGYVEVWFNDSMERVAGWYKRRSHLLIFGIGMIIALVINGDSITIANDLANDKPLRDSLVAASQTYVGGNSSSTPATATPEARLQNIMTTISGLGLPIGWDRRDTAGGTVPGRIPTGWGWLLKLLGCLATACATALGAPFWFDILNKIINVRSTVKPKRDSVAIAGR